MNSDLWAKVHGATTHFPIALIFVAAACDTAALWLWHRPAAALLRAAGLGAVGLAALACVPVVISGLMLTHGNAWGQGPLRRHHGFVWPAFALVVGAAAWRALTRREATRSSHATYMLVAYALAALFAGAGYWGGELLQSFP